jgi:hypothetical protein
MRKKKKLICTSGGGGGGEVSLRTNVIVAESESLPLPSLDEVLCSIRRKARLVSTVLSQVFLPGQTWENHKNLSQQPDPIPRIQPGTPEDEVGNVRFDF